MVAGLGRDSVLTEATGFPLWLEMTRFFADINCALCSGGDLVEAVESAADELEVNIRTYNLEFIKSKTVIPHKNRLDTVYSFPRMIGNNGRPLLDAISPHERRGAVRVASAVIESFLLGTDTDSFAVMMSPSGWSGYVDENGQDINYLNTETMIFWKNHSGILTGLTLVTDLTLGQAEAVMNSLGVDLILTETDEKERLVAIVSNPALLSFPRSHINPFEYVLDKILAQRGTEAIKLLHKDGSCEERSVEQTREDIRRFDELLLFDQKEEELIFNLREFIRENIYRIDEGRVQEALAKEIERTVLSLVGEYLKKNTTTWEGFPDWYTDRMMRCLFLQNPENFWREIAFLKSRAGCSTGISSAAIMPAVSSSGSGILTAESDHYGSLEFYCPRCHKINRRPKGKLIPNCQHCGTTDVRC